MNPSSSSSAPSCPQCGQPVPVGAALGVCPACLLAAGFATQTEPASGAFTPPSMEELALRFPQLELIEVLGRGGMGVVYKARQRALDRFVALKILPPALGDDPAFAGRFAHEARALGQLNHPGIVTLYEFGRTDDGWFFILMEFVDGVNLRQLLGGGRVAPREALAIVPALCDALQYAHDLGIVHRDIKPENILLDRRGRVKIADFGLAKLIRAPAEAPAGKPTDAGTSAALFTEMGKVMGTPSYMAPEQTDHPSSVDHRADIYALGVVFYQMLTGELPGKSLEAPSAKVSIDVRLDEVVLRALEKDPALRYQQASSLKTRVETIATGLTGVAASGDALSKNSGYRSFLARWKYLPGRVAVMGVAAVAMLLIAFTLYRRANIDGPVTGRDAGTEQERSGGRQAEPPTLRYLAWQDDVQKNPQWRAWQPNGERVRPEDLLLPSGFTASEDVSKTSVAAQAPRFLCLWFSHPAFDTLSVCKIKLLDAEGKPLVTPTNHFATGVYPPSRDNHNLGWITASVCAGRRGEIPPIVDVVLGYSVGPWRYWDDLAVDFHGGMTISHGVLVTDPGQDADGKAYVQLTRDRTQDSGNEQFDFIAVTKDGRKLQRIGQSEYETGNIKTECTSFDVPLVQVKNFQIRKRPIHTLTSTIALQTEPSLAKGDDPARAATPAVEAWLASMDRADYAQGWDAAAVSFQQVVTKDAWVAESRKVRQPLGALLSRTVSAIRQTATLPGLPDGAYVVAEYDTSFSELKSAVETLTCVKEKDGHWKVAGYLIRPRTETEKIVVRAAEEWLAGIDAGKYAQSWTDAAEFFRVDLPQKKWEEALTTVRQPLGKLLFRSVQSAHTVTKLPGAPDGHYVVMQFATAYAEDRTNVETVTFMLGADGRWKAVGYFIK